MVQIEAEEASLRKKTLKINQMSKGLDNPIKKIKKG